MKFDETCYWLDSLITLFWIKSFEKECDIFVENRVREIRKLTDIKQWRHIKTKHNPADLIAGKRFNINLANENFWCEGTSL